MVKGQARNAYKRVHTHLRARARARAHKHKHTQTQSPFLPPPRIVSATDLRKYDTVPALQDNAEIVFRSLAGRGHALRWALYGDWVHTKEFLGAVLAVAFSVAYDQVGVA